MFATGAERKVWVMNMVKAAASQIDFNYDADAERKVSDLVDEFCRVSKTVNAGG